MELKCHIINKITTLIFTLIQLTSNNLCLLSVTTGLITLETFSLAVNGCSISEFTCRNGQCVRLDKYCDSINDCGDNSDEPKYCTVCNRTYYGDVGKTYELNLSDQAIVRMPFLCHLTFTANGHTHGDIVQLIFDAFKVGRYDPQALDGCPDGYMQLSELGRPFTGGSWCGSSSGYAVYYSETSTITASLKLFRLHPGDPFEFRLRFKFILQLDAVVRFGIPSAPLERGQVTPGTYCTRNYEECYRKPCKLQSPNYPGMYPRNVTCYWSLRQKDIPTCKHAMIAVRQESEHKIQMKRSVSMANFNKTARALRTWRECTGERDHLIFYDGPSTNDPVLMKYCGGDWLPRVISRGPEMLVAFHSSPFSVPLHMSSVTSPLRGFELDVDIIFADSDSLDYSRESTRCEFHINASSQDEDNSGPGGGNSPSGGGLGRGGRRGSLTSPKHTLAPNTTCSWTFHGRPGDLVWIYFVSYSQYSLIPSLMREDENKTTTNSPEHYQTLLKYINRTSIIGDSIREYQKNRMLGKGIRKQEGRVHTDTKVNITELCTTRLRVWDGGGEWGSKSVLIADHCENPPKLCDHTSLSNSTRITRPCKSDESYISTGSTLLIKHHTLEGTALHPANFKLRYEFIDTRLGGEYWTHRDNNERYGTCQRIFRNEKKGKIFSPKNVFMYGRGGAKNLSCLYRIEVEPGERIKLTLHNISFGDNNNHCRTELDPHTARPRCVSALYQHHSDEHLTEKSDVSNRIAEIKIFEAPWAEAKVPISCICDNYTAPDAEVNQFISSSNAIEISFHVSAFNINEDYRSLYFRGEWNAEKISPYVDCAISRRLVGSGGEIIMSYPYSSKEERACTDTPYFIESHSNSSIFIQTWGSPLPLPANGLPSPSQDDPNRCTTKNRIMIYSRHPHRLIKVVCPSEPNTHQYTIHIYSEEWFGHNKPNQKKQHHNPSFIIHYVAREPGAAGFNWLLIKKSKLGILKQIQQYENDVYLDKDFTNQSLVSGNDCFYKCPELNACIGSALWCDGVNNCPSGYDENKTHCGVGVRFFNQFPGGVYSAMACSAAVLAACVLLTIFALIAKFRKSGKSNFGNKFLSTDGLNSHNRRFTEELLLNPSIASSTMSS